MVKMCSQDIACTIPWYIEIDGDTLTGKLNAWPQKIGVDIDWPIRVSGSTTMNKSEEALWDVIACFQVFYHCIKTKLDKSRGNVFWWHFYLSHQWQFVFWSWRNIYQTGQMGPEGQQWDWELDPGGVGKKLLKISIEMCCTLGLSMWRSFNQVYCQDVASCKWRLCLNIHPHE